MYPLPTNPSPSTSTSVPRPTSTSKPISPQRLTENQNTESSPQSSLPCGQRTPASSTSTSDTPSQHTPPHSQPQSCSPTPTHHTSPKPHKPQDIQHSPVKTNVNPPTQPPISDKDQQCVPKLTNGSQVKCSKPQPRQQDEHLCFYCNQLGHLKRNCPKISYCSKCRTRGYTPDRCTSKPQQNGHTHQAGESRDQRRRNQDLPQFLSHHNRCLHCAGDHQTKDCTTTRQQQTRALTVLLVVQVFQHTKMHQTHHIHLYIPIHSLQPATNTASLLYMYKYQPLTLTLHNFNQTYTKLLPHHLHKMTQAKLSYKPTTNAHTTNTTI